MDNHVQGVVLAVQVDEAQKQRKIHNLVQGDDIPEDVGATCGRNCSDSTMSSLTSESVEKIPPLFHNDAALNLLETNGTPGSSIFRGSFYSRKRGKSCQEVEVANILSASENLVTCNPLRQTESNCRKVCESSSSLDEHDGVRSTEDHLDEHVSCVEINCQKLRKVSEFSADSIKGESSTSSPVVHDTVESACAKHSVEGVLHDGLKSLYPEKDKVGSCTVIQIDDAFLVDEDASGAPSKDETGDVCKMSSVTDSIKGESSTMLPVVHDSLGSSCSKHSVEEVLDDGLRRLVPETENVGSCTLLQVDEVPLLREDASEASFEDETGDLCKISSPIKHVDKQSERTVGGTEPSAAEDCSSKDENFPNNEVDLLPPERPLSICLTKKLLVLDVNGILADIVYWEGPSEAKPDTVISNRAVFTRPFYKDFLDFCFMHFNVGIWTSRTKRNVESILDFLLGESKNKLLFCWDQSHCTVSGFGTVEDRRKPLIIKKLKKLWEKDDPHLPWVRGVFNESNTLLLDDTPHKAICNPPHTAIFPESFQYTHVNDTLLSPEGELRAYLKGAAEAENIQTYVKENPYGQRPITERNLSWRYYQKVIAACSSSSDTVTDRYDSYHRNSGSAEAAPCGHTNYHWNANHPPPSSDIPPRTRRYENHHWKANHFPSSLEAASSRDRSYHWRANKSPHSEPFSYSHGSFRSEAYNSSSSSEEITRRRGGSYYRAVQGSSSSEANHDRRGNYHWTSTHSSSASEANHDRRGNYHWTSTHSSSSSEANHDRRGNYHWTSTHSSSSSEANHDRRGNHHWISTHSSSSSEANHDRRGNRHWTPPHSLSSSGSGFNGRGNYHRKPNYLSSSSQDLPYPHGSFHWRIYNMQPSSEGSTYRPGNYHQEANQ